MSATIAATPGRTAADDCPRGPAITLLQNGDEIFPAMLEAIRNARRTITFETFVYWRGEIADTFAEALSDRARAGVAVHVLLDWVGCLQMDDRLIDRMVAAGVEVEKFRPLRWFNFRRANCRTHRKLLIVDGAIGFTGGVGVADQWSGNAQDPEHWRDNHYRIEGRAVNELQRAFFKNWLRVGRSSPGCSNTDYFPQLPNSPEFAVVAASPSNGNDSLHALFRDAVETAEAKLRIATAYFMPDEELFNGLLRARKRGVARLVLPDVPEPTLIALAPVKPSAPLRWRIAIARCGWHSATPLAAICMMAPAFCTARLGRWNRQ